MLTEEQAMNKLRVYADEYKRLVRRKKYVQAMNIYYSALNAASFNELSKDEMSEVFGSDGQDGIQDKKESNGLFDRRTLGDVGFLAIKEEIEENRRGNPTQIHDFVHHLPISHFLKNKKEAMFLL